MYSEMPAVNACSKCLKNIKPFMFFKHFQVIKLFLFLLGGVLLPPKSL
jgi:hypothetical protein